MVMGKMQVLFLAYKAAREAGALFLFVTVSFDAIINALYCHAVPSAMHGVETRHEEVISCWSWWTKLLQAELSHACRRSLPIGTVGLVSIESTRSKRLLRRVSPRRSAPSPGASLSLSQARTRQWRGLEAAEAGLTGHPPGL